MTKFIKFLMFLFFIGVGAYLGKPLWYFVTNTLAPEVKCKRLSENPNFKGIADFELEVKSVCSLCDLQVSVDEKPLEIDLTDIKGKISSKPKITFNASGLDDGEHTFCITAVDGGYKSSKKTVKYPFFVDNLPLRAELVRGEHCVKQGQTLHITVQANKSTASIDLKFAEDIFKFAQSRPNSAFYECFVPIDCDAAIGKVPFEVCATDSVGNKTVMTGGAKIVAANFSKKANLSISSAKLADEREKSVSDAVLGSALEKWTKSSSEEKLWSGPFEVPTIVQRYSTPFGEIRTTPEKGRYVHKAVDIVNSPKAVVWASQSGKVIIKERFWMTGNTVAIDHGMGVLTLYCHLDDFSDIDVGDMVQKGNPVGKIGRTGYATGYHLHWELRVNNMAVDPLQWTKRTF
ncbi:M23 family metallopeptidase [Candidatus Dependentiae bacterium]